MARGFILCLLALGLFGAMSAHAAGRGAQLTRLLEELRTLGYQIVYSNEVVRPGMRVSGPLEDPPTLESARRALDRHGLLLVEREQGVYLVVRCTDCRQTIRGRVMYEQGDLPIRGALITLRGPTVKSIQAGRDGSYLATDLPPGRYEISAEAASFRPSQVSVEVPAGADLVVDLRLEFQATLLEKVVVTPDRFDIAQQTVEVPVSFQRDDLKDAPLRLGETMAMTEMLPGMAIGTEEAAPRIRGSTGRDILVVIDGMELYEPYHLPDFRSPFSLVDPETVDKLEIHTGGMSVEFGDRFGGLVSIETPRSAKEKPGSITLGTANSRMSWSGSVGNRGTWSTGFRMWYPNQVFSTLDLGDDELDPQMADAFAKMHFRVGSRHSFSAHLLGGNDNINFAAVGGDDLVRAALRTRYLWGRWIARWSDSTDSETVLGIGRVTRARDGWSKNDRKLISTVRDDRKLELLFLSQKWTHRLGDRHLITAGLSVRGLLAKYDYEASIQSDQPIQQRNYDLEPSGTVSAGFFSDRWRVSDRFVLEIGGRWDYQSYIRDQQFSPRLHAAWSLSPQSAFRLSLGRYAQSQRIHELEIEDAVTTFAPAQISDQASAAWESEFASGWRVRVGAYERRMKRLRPRFENLYNPIELLPEVEKDRVTIDAERARASGVEFSLESSRRQRRVSARLAYTYSRIEDLVEGLGGNRWIPRSWDQRHAATGLLTFQLSDRSRLVLAGYARSGWPTTPVIGPPGADVEALRNTERFPSYFRLDIRYTLSSQWNRAKLRFDFTLTNALDQRNICCKDIEVDPRSGETLVGLETWTGIAPIISTSLQF